MAVFSLSAWDLLGLKLTSLADLLWRRISAQRDSAANVLVRVQLSFQIKSLNAALMNTNQCFHLCRVLMKVLERYVTRGLRSNNAGFLDRRNVRVHYGQSTIWAVLSRDRWLR